MKKFPKMWRKRKKDEIIKEKMIATEDRKQF